MNGYTLFLGALILVGGAGGDRLGRLRLFLFAGTVASRSPRSAARWRRGYDALIAARLVQGIGAALMVPQSLAIISAAFPPELRGRAIGTWAGAISTALAPAVGGLVDTFGWRAAFSGINLPLAAVVVVLARADAGEPVADGRAARLGGRGASRGGGGAPDARTEVLAEPGRGGAAAVGLLAAGALAPGSWRSSMSQAPLVRSLFARAHPRRGEPDAVPLRGLSGALFLLPFELIGRRGIGPTGVGRVRCRWGW